MDVAGIVEAGVFFLFATITIGGALGANTCSKSGALDVVTHFLFHGSIWDFHSVGCRVFSSNTDFSLSCQRWFGSTIRYNAD